MGGTVSANHDSANLLEVRGLTKIFGTLTACNHIDLNIAKGEIHALLGENGAGKSTLVKMLFGSLEPNSGEIFWDGQPVRITNPGAAKKLGIGMVFQHFSLFEALTAAENIALSLDDGSPISSIAAKARALSYSYGLPLDPESLVGDLSVGERQRIEIIRCLLQTPQLIILDEPTSVLTPQEADKLFETLERLRSEGKSILYISHRLNEVMTLCQHVTVLKDGTCTADRSLDGTDAAGLVRLMVGRDPGDLFPKWQASASPATAISVRNFAAGLMRDVDLDIRTGEVLGIGGLVGQGQEDLLLGLYGAIPARTKSATVNGAPGLPGGVPKANALGLAYVPADRKREGLHLIHPIITNMMLPAFARLPALKLRSRQAERKTAKGLAAQLAIKGDLERPAQALSGGNQQKVALAKWMSHDPLVLLLNDPTRGVDVETKREIYLMLRAFAAAGKAVVLLSSDTPELVHLCDRVAVVREGRIAATLERAALSEEAIVSAAMGAERQKVAA
ncbi:MAG: sugar ABC transporter ATP-binding protein [Mesorhizobium sp.]|nr:MAG: sugar ABC transporter ATP-binding protein [Mesorhizobium sp.]